MMQSVTTMPERRGRPGGPSRFKTVVVIAVVLLVGMWLHSREEARQNAEQPAPASQPRTETVPRGAESPANRRESAGQPAGAGAGAGPREAREARGAGAPRESVEAGDDRYDLEADEERGGHTLARHVGKTDDELRERLDHERGISAASTYSSRAVAERTVARTLHDQQDRVEAWSDRRGNRPNLALDYHGRRGEVLGRSLRRGRDPVDCGDAVVVLRWAGRDYYVLTTYPECSR